MYYVDDGGTRLKGDLFSVGSGSTFAYGVLDTEYDYELNDADAIELGRRSIYHAAHRDAYSGGTINGTTPSGCFIFTLHYFSLSCEARGLAVYRQLRRE